MVDKATTIVIKGKVGYEDEITVAQAAQIIAFLNAAEGDAPALGADLLGGAGAGTQGGGARGDGRTGKQVESAREALDVSGAKTNPEKIVALGAYVLQDGGDTFKVEDVKAQFRRARETAPGNFARDLAVAIQAGWLAQDEGNEYYITNKVQGIFDGDCKFPKAGNGAKPRASGKAGKAKPEKPEIFVAIDEFPTKLDGFPVYSRMKQNKDKMLWALKFAKTNGIKGLANKDIDWLTDHLGAGIPNKQITATFNSLKGAGYANRSTQDHTIRITDDGEAYLASVGVADS